MLTFLVPAPAFHLGRPKLYFQRHWDIGVERREIALWPLDLQLVAWEGLLQPECRALVWHPRLRKWQIYLPIIEAQGHFLAYSLRHRPVQ